jgi:hypothetical protein
MELYGGPSAATTCKNSKECIINIISQHCRWNNEKGAENLCKQLGYESGLKYRAPGGTGPIVAGNRLCRGGEATVYECPLKKKTDNLHCTHNNDQGVECEGGKSKNCSHLNRGEATVYDCLLKSKSDNFYCTHNNDQGVQCEGEKDDSR